jgi:CheY-like chemotaxis protein
MLKILLVEDERIVAMALKYELAQHGARVVAMATNGPDALKAVAENELDAVLMDVMIEGDMDGIETARQIAALHPVPILYLTGEVQEETYKRAWHSPTIAGYMIKPVQAAALAQRLQEIVAQPDTL